MKQNAMASAHCADLKDHDKVLIIDFGSQVTQLIARRVREHGVYCQIWPYNKVDEVRFSDFAPKAIILSGGPSSVTEKNAPDVPSFIFEAGLPIRGIC